MQFTSGKFQPELFSMTNAVDFEEDADYIVYETNRKYPTVTTPGTDDGTIVLTFGDGDNAELAKDANTGEYIISIPGLKLDSTASAVPSAGKFTVTESSGTFTVNIYKDDAVDADNKPIQMEVQFARVQAARVAEIDNKASAVGEAMLKYPIYSDGQDCTKSGILGYVYMHVYRARVTAQPGLNGSYKSAS